MPRICVGIRSCPTSWRSAAQVVRDLRLDALARRARIGRVRGLHQRRAERGDLVEVEPAKKDDALDPVAEERVGESGEALAQIGEGAIRDDELAVDERDDD